jgi:hypothetical protein
MSRRALFLLASSLLLVLCGCTMWPEAKVSNWKNATGAEAFERLLWQEVKAKNWVEVEAHLASNFVYQDKYGRADKQKFVSDLKDTVLEDLTLGEIEVTANGTEAVVTYTAQFRGTYQGKALLTEPAHVMTVWQQHKGGWVAIAMSQSR